MANVFANLPLPGANGVGAAVNTSTMGRKRTIMVSGSFTGAFITIEASVDGGATFAAVASFRHGIGERTIELAAQYMRARVAGRTPFVPFDVSVDISSTDDGATFLAIPLPAGNGPGPAVSAAGLGSFHTAIASGSFQGARILLEVSADGSRWLPLASFAARGGVISRTVTAAWYRANVKGRLPAVPFSGSLSVGAVNDAAAGGGGGGEATDTTITANHNVVSTLEDTPVSGNLILDDTTTEGTLSIIQYTIAGEPALYLPGDASRVITGCGSIVVAANGAFTFTPLTNYTGAVPVLQYWVTNGHQMRVATLTLTVLAANDGPVAYDDYALSFQGEAVTLDVLQNDVDPDGDTFTLATLNGVVPTVGVAIPVTDGSVVLEASGSITVTPDALFEGTITFPYTITDGALSDTGLVTIQVGAENLSMFSPAAPALDGDLYGLAIKNHGLTYRGHYGNDWNNGINVSIPPYSAGQGLFDLANREPWLYDRATTLYKLYLRTGDATILAEARVLADAYMAAVNVTGGGAGAEFTIVGGAAGAQPTDVKYLYGIIGVWYERAFGSTVHRSKCQAMYNQTLLSFTQTWVNNAELWTERNSAYAIQNCLSWYWLSGDTAALADAIAYFDDIILLSTGTGAPLHPHNQHEGSAITTMVTSPWMGALLAESAVQLYRTSQAERTSGRILQWLYDYATFIHDHCCYLVGTPDEPEFAGMVGNRLPAYLAGTALQFPEGQSADMEHSFDVAGLIKKGIWAGNQLSLPVANLETLRDELLACAEVMFAYWTRTTVGYPRYRVNPPRKYGWWMHGTYSEAIDVGVVPFPPVVVATPTVSGSTQQGQTLTVAPGTWNGTPTPTLTYQWTRNNVAIAGQTGLTYATVLADVGASVRCVETATNTGGANTSISNAILVVAAGAPEVTVHPTDATAAEGVTANFTATCTATPAATFQWQVSTNGGGSWANVAEGTGGSGSGNTTTYTTEILAADDNGDQYRCVFTNAGGFANSNAGSLSMVVAQDAVRFAGSLSGAHLTFDIGGPGHVNFTLEMLVYLEGRTGLASIVEVNHTGNGRTLAIQHDNVFEVYLPSLGDSNTGVGGGATPDWSANPPPLNTWLYMTFRSPNTPGGMVEASWTTAEGASGTVYYADRANGIEASVQGQRISLNGGGGPANGSGDGIAAGVRYQYVRGKTGYVNAAAADAERQSVSTAGWDFWWVFADNGGGGVTVTDATGNGRVPTIVSGTLATGPTVPSV
jgi:hypothetical protein